MTAQRPASGATTHAHWPVKPDQITLRVCADLGWLVTIDCPKCRVGSQVVIDRVPAPLQAVPLYKLFADQAFKCRKVQYGCNGTAAERIVVSCMDVGRLKAVARWERS